ncbi:bifunctional lysylphosphatidylglycerol flippase/synthetase MprF [Labrys monachus]|uniref:Phosphatidylglycerol lysyltransferase n=1 Tax=Labrys monachus TaxID=217067 RepID=A0ABU0FDD5_9HYPH|nr:bifunctional lysylphosphatidylglycerol flippase/synthetase MprF [Labrys monachus]MDQ0392461.1 phosphatidylglycerol lysyltransferase [Labrys monachus]
MTASKDENQSPASTMLVPPPRGGKTSWLRRALRAVPWNYVGPILSIGLFVGALAVLASLLREVKPDEVAAAFTATPTTAIIVSILCTACSYLALTGYDGLALRQIGAKDIPYSTAAIGSFTSYAISYTLGVPLLTAGAVRYRVYGGAGLSAPQIAALTLVCTLTFWLGMGAVLALGLVLVPGSVAGVDHLPLTLNMSIGVAIIVVIVAYVAYVASGRRVVALEGWSLPLPDGRVTAIQIVLGVLDVCAGAGALYVLLPDQAASVPFFTFMVIYVLAAFLGVLSHAPGGIGVFEATMLVALPGIPETALLGRILLFRVIYYFVPFALALAILGIYELARRRHVVDRLVDQASGVMKPLAPILVSGAAFLAGTALLVTGAVPAGEARRSLVETLIPLPVVEIAHVAATLAGVALLFLSRGLIRRVETAWHAAGVVLSVAILASLLRSADWRFALVLCGALLVLALSRPAFPRVARLFGLDFSPLLLGAIAAVLVVTTWIGFFAFRFVAYSPQTWISFGYGEEMSRFLRAAALALLAAVVIGVLSFRWKGGIALLPAASLDLSGLVASTPSAEARLALLPGQTLLASDQGNAAMVVARAGASSIALGDPLGLPGLAQELVWVFSERAERQRLWPVILSASPQMRSDYLEAGLTLTPIGDRAWLDLPTLADEPFSGANAIFAWADAQGLSLDLVPAGAMAAATPALHAVSQAWLTRSPHAEGYFTLGRFLPEWIKGNDCAILRRAGEIVGFAVVMRGGGNEEWAVDILRYLPELGPNALDFMLLRLMRLAKARGVRRFDLGLTPNPARATENLGPAWQRVTPLLFRFGDHIANFDALRGFKARFNPHFEPRYLACTAGFALPHILQDITALIERGGVPPR